MLSIQSKIFLGLIAVVIVAAGLTIWLILAWGNGPLATFTPLVLALVVGLAARNPTRKAARKAALDITPKGGPRD